MGNGGESPGERRGRRRADLYDALPDPTVVVDAEEWRVRVVNDAAAELFGRDRATLLGTEVSELFPPSQRDRNRRLLERTVAGDHEAISTAARAAEGGQFHVVDDDGLAIPVEVSATPVDLDGRACLQATLRAVGDRERRGEGLERLGRATRRLLRVDDGEDVANVVGDVAGDVLGLPIHTVMLYDDVDDVLRPVAVSASGPEGSEPDPPATLSRGEGVAWKAFEGGEALVSGDVREDPDVYDPETRVRSEFVVPIGEYGVLVASSTVEGDFDPVDVSLAKTLAANAEAAFQRLESERELRDRSRHLGTVVDNAPIVLFAFDGNGTFTVSEGKGLESLGLEPGDAVGESVFEFYAGHDGIVDAARRALAGESVDGTFEVGGLVFEAWFRPIVDDGSEGVIGVAVEVTERERRERLVRVLNRFLRHNLRNAMNVIVGYARRLEDHDDPEVRAGVDRIFATGEDVTRLSEKARRLSRLVAQDRTPEVVDVRSAVPDVVGEVEATHAGTVTCRNLDGDPLPVDRTVELAVREVVENALKHADGTDPRATVSVTERPDRGEAVVHVVDDGPGLPEQERTVLESDDETPLDHGSGLGLFVAYWAMTDAGGDIEVRSVSDRGTAITLAAPIVSEPT